MSRRMLAVAALGLAFSTQLMPAFAEEVVVKHPASIVLGSCDTLGDDAYDLTVLEYSSGEAVGPDGAVAVAYSDSQVSDAITDLTDNDHAVVVYASESDDTVVACGEIGGVVTEGTLQFGIAEVNDSHHNGIVVLTDNGDGTTKVDVWIHGGRK